MSEPPDLPGVRHEYVDAGGLRTHIALAGPEDGPPVLLVHGWPQHWWTWRNVIPGLAARYRVIAPDLRGHGWTDKPHDGFEKQQLATDLLALLDALGLERVTWVGHDWGGYVGFLTALRAPERIERMLAVCIPHPWTKRDPRLFAVMLAYQGPISLPLIGPRVADPMVRRILQTGRRGDRLSREDVALFADHIPAATTVGMYRTFLTREVLPVARGSLAGKVLQVPTTVVLGARDLVTSSVTGGPVSGQPQLQVEVLPDVAHWVPEQRPRAIVDRILAH